MSNPTDKPDDVLREQSNKIVVDIAFGVFDREDLPKFTNRIETLVYNQTLKVLKRLEESFSPAEGNGSPFQDGCRAARREARSVVQAEMDKARIRSLPVSNESS